MEQQAGLSHLIAKYADLLIAGLVMTILALIVLPIPTGIVDILLAVNISIAALVLLTALYVPDAMKLPSFPTILLLTTLFRLGLNITTTRLILLQADAGDIIQAFGNFVVGGNMVVGAVVFIVIVLVQFIVIAKGSERVAEVSARFTLDAMPGKQMSIDADLRGGLIDPQKARERRQHLERESKLYGAMDGAMKFVKGDAIAGIIISLVNVIGGLIIGVMQLGMPVGEAAETYALLTIGDGLVSQIPALLLSVSAGLVVTRVAAGGEDEKASNVGREMVQQIMAQPKAIAVVVVVLLIMAVLPGFPSGVFIALAFLALMVAISAKKSPQLALAGAGAQGGMRGEGEEQEDEAGAGQMPQGPIAIALEIHPALEPLFIPPQDEEQVGPNPAILELEAMRRDLAREMGMPFPPVIIRIADDRFDTPGYSISIYEAPVARSELSANHAFIITGDKDDESLADVFQEIVTMPGRRVEAAVVPLDQMEAAVARVQAVSNNGTMQQLYPRQAMYEHLRLVMRKHAADLLGIQETSDMVEMLKEQRPELVKAVTPVQINMAQLTDVLQSLLRERIPIRDMRRIFESVAKWAPRLQRDQNNLIDINTLTELVRQEMKRTVCSHYAGGKDRLPFYSVSPDVENLIADAMQQSPTGPVLALGPEQRQQIVNSFMNTVNPYKHLRNPAVIVVNQPSIRRAVWRLLEPYMPEVVVMAYQDLTPDLAVDSLGLVMVDGDE